MLDMPYQRIAVSGSAGIGKSTLCQKLADVLRYPLIPDVVDEVLTEYSYSAWGETVPQSDAVKIRLEALRRKIRMECSNDAFVSDKSVVDYLAYWDLNTASDASTDDSKQFEEKVAAHIERYDLVLLLLWGRIPIEDNKKRHVDPSHQLRVHSTIVRRLVQLRVPFVVFDQFSANSPDDIHTRLACTGKVHGTSPRVGLFIGTFDPPTKAHLRCALQALDLMDQVWFCPNPYNPNCPRIHLSLAERSQMLRLLVLDHPDMKVYLRELNPYISKYTTAQPRSELIREVSEKFPSIEPWVIMGVDKLKTPAYRAPDPLLRQTGHLIFCRPEEPDPRMLANLYLWVVMPPVGAESSSKAKQLLTQGSDASLLLTPRVAEYIRTFNLYQK